MVTINRIYIILALALLLSVSCSKEMEPKADGNTIPVALSASAEQQEDITKTSLSSAKNVIWSETDQISVLSGFGSKNSNNLFFVSAIDPDDATKATFSGSITTGREVYYALYPYDEGAKFNGSELSFTIPQTQTYAAGSFGPGANVSVARFENPGDALYFKNILGVFKLSITGNGENVSKIVLQNRNGEALWGNATLEANDKLGTYAQNLTLKGGDNTIILDCSASPVVLSSTAKDFYFTAPAASFESGLDVVIFDADGAFCQLGTSQDNSLLRSRILAMPTIPAQTTEVNLSAHGTANCYMVNARGSYSFKAAKGCGGSEFEPASVEVLWATEGVLNAPASLETIINDVSYGDGFISFNATGKPGNAVIAAFDATGKIKWSWHIWSTGGYVKTVPYPVASKVKMMDRQLGGLGCTKEEGALCSGMVYQWGRKDPFPGAATIAAPTQSTTAPKQAGSIMKAGYSFNSSDNSVASVGTTAYTIEHPTTFVSCATGYNDNDWLVGHDASLWTPDKGVNDPCPPGYRVPDQMRDWAIDPSQVQFLSNYRGFVIYGNQWFGEHGYLYRCTGGWCEGPYDAMVEWWGCSASVSDSYYFAAHTNSGNITPANTTPKRANAYGVRCCKDIKY